MTPIVWRTKYGDTIFMSNPVKAAKGYDYLGNGKWPLAL